MTLFTCAGQSLVAAASGNRIRVPVSLGDATSLQAADAFRANLVAYQHELVQDFVWDKFFTDHRVGDVLIDPKWEILLPSTDMPDMLVRMQSLDDLVLRTVAAGGRVHLVFQAVPRWLSSDPMNEAEVRPGEKVWHNVPPSDYLGWQEVVREFVHHFNNVLDTRGQVYYTFGNEPDNYWLGTEEEFFLYYEHAVLGALVADPDVRIGGIAPSSHDADVFSLTGAPTAGGMPLLYNWILHCVQNSLPIDIVTWHSYPAASPVPGDTTYWKSARQQIDEWLFDAGFDGQELLVTDWPEWKVHPENDHEFKASWITSGLISMANVGLYNPTYLGLADGQLESDTASNASFGGGTGLFTSLGIAKSPFNAYTLLSRMEGQVVPIDTGDDFLQAVASVDGQNRVYILLSHFIPSSWLILMNPLDESFDMEQIEQEMLQLAADGTDPWLLLDQVLTGAVDIDSLNVSPMFKDYLRRLQMLYDEGQVRLDGPISVLLTLDGLPGGSWKRTDTVVDSTQGNAYTYRADIQAQLEPLILSQDADELRRQILDVNQAHRAPEFARDFLTVSGSGQQDIEVEIAPHGVVLIQLSLEKSPSRLFPARQRRMRSAVRTRVRSRPRPSIVKGPDRR